MSLEEARNTYKLIENMLNELYLEQKQIIIDKEELEQLKIRKTEISNEVEELRIKLNEKVKEISLKLRTINDEVTLLKRKYITTYEFKNLLFQVDNILHNNDEFFNILKKDNNEFNQIKDIYYNRQQWHIDKNTIFVKEEIERYSEFFDTVEEGAPLTSSQREAIVTNDNSNLVLAGAGSGKTSVLVANVLYLLEAGLAKEEEILLLAFNKNAAKEIRTRLQLDKVTSKTFHSLGFSKIIPESLNKRQTPCPWAGSSEQSTIVFRSLIQNELETNMSFLAKFTMYFIEDFKPYKSIFSFKTKAEYIDYLRSKDIVTLKNGEPVKSYEELMIANYLYLKNIEYIYEHPYEIETATLDRKQYQPDFYLPEYGVYIEHFGIDRNYKTASYVDNTKYIEDMEWKRQTHQDYDTKLIETYSYERMDGNLLEKLEEKLDELNVEKKDIDFDKALQELIEDKAVLSTFTNLIMTYLGHFINGKHTIENLLENAKDKRIRTFIELFDVINTRYIEKKNKCACVDYNDMISKALEHLEQKNFTSKYKYIFVDEFQDISILRNEMVKELTSLNENACIKVVGDDWQAINKFAGSDVMIIKNFQNHYNDAKRVDLKDTFRFGKTIADISKKFIMKNRDSQISKDINTLKGKESNIYVYWDNYSRKDEEEKNSTAHIRDVIDKLIEKDPQIKEILITGRYKFLLKKEQLEEIKRNYSNIDISFKSVHSSKGLGMDYVIVLGMEEGYNGFPSEKENDPIIDSVLKNEESYPYAEERRLFYVALTRVKKDIVFVSNPKKTSSFLKEIIRDNKDLITELNSNPMSKHDVCPQCNNGYLIEQKQFAYCTDSKFCKYKEKIQPRCKHCNTKLVFDETKRIRYCSNHPSYTVESCKSCDDGYMIDKGSFFGCSNYPTEDCKYTVSK